MTETVFRGEETGFSLVIFVLLLGGKPTLLVLLPPLSCDAPLDIQMNFSSYFLLCSHQFYSLTFFFSNRLSHVLSTLLLGLKNSQKRQCSSIPPSLPPSLVSVLMTCWTFIVTMLLVAELCQCGTESWELISECVLLQRFVCVCVLSH